MSGKHFKFERCCDMIDTSDETIPLYESDPRYPHDNGGETVLLAETEEPDFKIDF